MNDLYPQYPCRQSLSLDGFWDFFWLGDVDLSSVTPEHCNRQPAQVATVPGCYNLAGERIGQRGAALYRVRFTFAAGAVRLKFGGLGMYARVWVDGTELGEIKTPYTTVAFDFTLNATANDSHELVVLVDNRFGNQATTPLFKPYADFHGYGGIYRSVTLMQLPASRIERVQVETLDTQTGLVRLQLRLGKESAKAAQPATGLRIRYAFDGAAPTNALLESSPDSASLAIDVHVPQHKVWSPDSPALHALRLTVFSENPATGETLEDTIIERFGIRTVSTRGKEILLNGEPVRLLGVNRHESHPQFGAAQPHQLIVDDLLLAKELNANFIRTAHYEPDAALLSLCDQMGFLVWAESFGWQQPEADARSPEICALFKDATAALVEESLNNPCVIMYGFLNESCSETEAGRALYKSLADTIRSIDSTRLVSYATDRFETDLCLDFADVISVNLYPGWINRKGSPATRDWISTPLVHIRPEFDYLSEYFSQVPQAQQKPLLVSESGVAAIYGMRDRTRIQWSEEFQQDYLQEAVCAVLDNPRYCGTTIWQLHDTRSWDKGPEVRSKPRGFNSGGLLDEYRRPKLAFDTVKDLFARYGKEAD